MRALYLLVILMNTAYILAAGVYKVTGITTTLNIRKAANTNSAVVGSLKNGQFIYATSVSGGWAKFYKGYVSTSYLTKVTSGTKYQTNDNLNFRTGPSTSYGIITTINKGIVINYFGRDPFTSTWAVTGNGYASAQYLTLNKKTSSIKKTTTTKTKANGTTQANPTTLVNSLLIFEEGTGPNGACGAYIDSLGYPTIGYGQLCKQSKVSTQAQANAACSSYINGCTVAKAKQWLTNEINSKTQCINNYNVIKNAYNKASDKRKAIIISMAYQLGCYGLSQFTTTLGHMANGNWDAASTSMMDSLWARQTPNRAKRHAYVIKNNNCGDFCKNYGW